MAPMRLLTLVAGCWLAISGWAGAADDVKAHITDWPPTTMPGALATSAIFGFVGIVLAMLGFKIFDWLTPGNMQKEIFENKNMAAAILGAAVIIGLCHIIASAVH
jgi:hypothetical protein